MLHERADKLGQWCSAEEISLLHSIIESIPHTDTLTHNDLHPGNIMIQDGELLLIDMPEVTLAPPICDLASIFRAMISAPENSPDGIEQIIGMPVDLNVIEQSIGMPADLILKAGYLFFEKYTGITDPTELEDYLKHITLLHAFNMVFKTVTGSERVRRAADAIMNNLLRGMVIPNEQTIRELFQTM